MGKARKDAAVPLYRSLDDLISELVARGSSQRDAVLQTIRDIENNAFICLDEYGDASAEDVKLWILQQLQSFAAWRPGTRPPALLAGTTEYVRNLRFRRIERKGSARAGAGHPEEFDWIEAEQYAMVLLKARGDPTNRLNQVEGWRSKTDFANAVLDHLQKRASINGEEVPSLNTVRNKVPAWLKKFAALN
jgi:hypothetical protein